MNCHNYQVQHGLLPVERMVPSPEELINLSKEDICKTLCVFVMEVKNSVGEDYNRDTLYDLIIMVQSFLKQSRYPVKFFEDEIFFDLKNTLDNRMKQLSKEGKIAPRIKAEPITINEEEALWNAGVLGDDNPEKLVNTVLYLNGVHFALRAADEHKSLKMGLQFKVGYDDSVGLKYLEYTECTSKCNQGGIASRNLKPKVSRAYENVMNSDRCMVRLYEKYISHRLDHLPKCSKDFYLRPLTVPHGNIWYSSQPRGRHMLGEVVKTLCSKVGLSGRRSNHSCRASTATRMYDSGADEQLICERTGHRSVAVRSYKRTSNKQLRDISNMLYGNITRDRDVTATVSKAPEVKDEENQEVKKPKIEVKDEKVEIKVGNTSPKMSVTQKSNQTCESTSIELPRGVVLNINVNFVK